MTAPPRRTAEEEKSEAQRKERIRDAEEGTGDLSDALDDSFPASDPPSMTQPKTKAGAPKGNKSTDQAGRESKG